MGLIVSSSHTGSSEGYNDANYRQKKAERGTSGVFWRPSEFALLGLNSCRKYTTGTTTLFVLFPTTTWARSIATNLI